MKKPFNRFLFALLLAFIGLGFYFYSQNSALRGGSEVARRKEAEELVAIVGKLIILPTGEVPTVATVTDPEKLKDQSFFAKAKTGDKVLMYQIAKKAYLYDVVANRILEVAPIILGVEEGAGVTKPTGASGEETDLDTDSVVENDGE